VGLGLCRRSDVRPRDDLDEWDARAVEVAERLRRRLDSSAVADGEGLARVFLLMGPLDADPNRLALGVDVEPTVVTDRNVELADLVVLGEIGVEVVLAVEHRLLADRA